MSIFALSIVNSLNFLNYSKFFIQWQINRNTHTDACISMLMVCAHTETPTHMCVMLLLLCICFILYGFSIWKRLRSIACARGSYWTMHMIVWMCRKFYARLLYHIQQCQWDWSQVDKKKPRRYGNDILIHTYTHKYYRILVFFFLFRTY